MGQWGAVGGGGGTKGAEGGRMQWAEGEGHNGLRLGVRVQVQGERPTLTATLSVKWLRPTSTHVLRDCTWV